MSVLATLSEERFLDEYWQRQPLLVRGAAASARGLVDGDTLAGLACEDAVQSRLVIHDPGRGTWQCEYGPFAEDRFAALPESGWTLLVQAVDQHLPDVARLLSLFAFLPRWRLDDVMVSYAAPGGGVGAHFDHYDVFLLQVHGTRLWELGQRCDGASDLLPHPDLKLLARFDAGEAHRLEPGDMLYLPPGLAHRGTALGGDCITCSVGFRAPSHGELLQGAAARLAAQLPGSARYRDTRESLDRDPYLVNAAALRELRRAWDGLAPHAVDAALAHAFGCQLTEPRHPESIGGAADVDPARAAARLAQQRTLRLDHDPASRFAYALHGGRAVLFVDGEAHEASAALACGVCHGRLRTGDLDGEHDRELLLALIGQGSVRLR